MMKVFKVVHWSECVGSFFGKHTSYVIAEDMLGAVYKYPEALSIDLLGEAEITYVEKPKAWHDHADDVLTYMREGKL